MKKYLPLLLVICCASCFSHRKIQFTGYVIEDISEVPIPTTEIILNGTDGSVSRNQSDSLGAFTFTLKRAVQYQVQFSKLKYLSRVIQINNVENHQRDILVSLQPFVNRDYLPSFYFDSLSTVTKKPLYDTLLTDIANVDFSFILVGYSSFEEPDSIAYERALCIKKKMIDFGTNPNLIKIEGRSKTFPQLRNHTFDIPSIDLVAGEDRVVGDSTLLHYYRTDPAIISAFMRQVQIEWDLTNKSK